MHPGDLNPPHFVSEGNMLTIEKKIAKEVMSSYDDVQLLYLPQMIITFDPININWSTEFINVSKRSEAMKMIQKSHVALKKTLMRGFHPTWRQNNIIKEDNNVRKTKRKAAIG